jgi:hypothetical protein
MTDLTITAANVLASGQATKETGIAGATITAGQPVYKEATTGTFKLSDSNARAEVAVYGVALHGSARPAAHGGQNDPSFTPAQRWSPARLLSVRDARAGSSRRRSHHGRNRRSARHRHFDHQDEPEHLHPGVTL